MVQDQIDILFSIYNKYNMYVSWHGYYVQLFRRLALLTIRLVNATVLGLADPAAHGIGTRVGLLPLANYLDLYIQSVHKFTYHSLHGSVHTERPHVKTEIYLLPLTAWECTYRASTCQN